MVRVTAEIQNISTDVNGKFVTLTPLVSAKGAMRVADSSTDMGVGLYGWLCGSTGTDLRTEVSAGLLPRAVIAI